MVYNEKSLRRYYDASACEYDRMYARRDPLWRRELEGLADAMKETLRGRKILEVACGTGFWTEIVAKVAEYVVAIDASRKMLEVARRRKPRSPNVQYLKGDGYVLEKVPGDFDAGLANFWFSHVPKSRVNDFLNGFHQKAGKAALVFMADNVYVPGIGGQLISKPGAEDTFKLRYSSNGSKYEVLKNYYNNDALWRLLAPKTSNLEVREGEYFWWVKYRIPNAQSSRRSISTPAHGTNIL